MLTRIQFIKREALYLRVLGLKKFENIYARLPRFYIPNLSPHYHIYVYCAFKDRNHSSDALLDTLKYARINLIGRVSSNSFFLNHPFSVTYRPQLRGTNPYFQDNILFKYTSTLSSLTLFLSTH